MCHGGEGEEGGEGVLEQGEGRPSMTHDYEIFLEWLPILASVPHWLGFFRVSRSSPNTFSYWMRNVDSVLSCADHGWLMRSMY